MLSKGNRRQEHQNVICNSRKQNNSKITFKFLLSGEIDMINRIHIVGASGSGTSTLAKAMSRKYRYKHFDTDHYYWLPVEEPFTIVRPIEDRINLLLADLQSHDKWVLSGSLCGWGDVFIPYFDLVIYIWIPKDIRMRRLEERETHRYGEDIAIGGRRYESYQKFMDWASMYDTAGIEMRSRALHEEWLAALPCRVERIEGDISVEDKLNYIEEIIKV